jgi:hypothetical protein
MCVANGTCFTIELTVSGTGLARDSQLSSITSTICHIYEGESNENLRSAMKIRNTVRLSCKLATVLLMV